MFLQTFLNMYIFNLLQPSEKLKISAPFTSNLAEQTMRGLGTYFTRLQEIHMQHERTQATTSGEKNRGKSCFNALSNNIFFIVPISYLACKLKTQYPLTLRLHSLFKSVKPPAGKNCRFQVQTCKLWSTDGEMAEGAPFAKKKKKKMEINENNDL